MSKIHYNPFYSSHDPYGEDSSEYGYCGTLLNEQWDNSTNDKSYVDCKKCIKLFYKADKEMEFHSDNFAKDCQSFVDFIEIESKTLKHIY